MVCFIAFVPEYINLDDFDKSAWDARFDFIDVDSSSFDPKSELTRHPHFVVIERGYIAYHGRTQADPVKISYNMDGLSNKLRIVHMVISQFAQADNGLTNIYSANSHLICYVKEGDPEVAKMTKDRYLKRLSVESYLPDSQGYPDISELAAAVRLKSDYKRDEFVVKVGSYFRIYSLETDTVYTIKEPARILTMLEVGSCTFQDVAKIDGRVPLKQQLSDFRLCDGAGAPLANGEEFWFQIYSEFESDIEETYDTTKESPDEIYANTDCVQLYTPRDPDQNEALSGSVGYPVWLSHTVVDGITYLMIGEKYLCFVDSNEIVTSSSIPKKEERLQIEYNYRGDILLSKWGGDVFVQCHYFKASVGIIGIYRNEISTNASWPMVLRLHRVSK